VTEPFFLQPPIPFVRPPAEGEDESFYPHNHCPTLTYCDNGDLLAAWFSTRSERGREMTILCARLRAGTAAWEPSSEFFKAPDRNMTGSSLLNDERGTLYHLNGLEAGHGWANLALAMRTSTDHGATWSRPRLIVAEHQRRNQVIDGAFVTADNAIVQPCDAVWRGSGGTAIHVSRDGGRTWTDPGAWTPAPEFVEGGRGGTIAGIHAGVVELSDGRLLAFGRGDTIRGQTGPVHNIGERMPQSLSSDGGRTWTYSASPFPPIGGGQRLVLRRLREGPLLFVSFTALDRAVKASTARRGTRAVSTPTRRTPSRAATWPPRRRRTGRFTSSPLGCTTALTWPGLRVEKPGFLSHDRILAQGRVRYGLAM
jgi:hypothetical protein